MLSSLQTRRQFFGHAALAASRRKPPNVLVMLSDQESALLPGPASLPNRRRLEKDGIRFTNAFCNTPQCSAARSALLTGLEPHRTGVVANVNHGSLGEPLSPAIPNIGSVFQAAGYSTGYFGKWHLGGDRERFGFATLGAQEPAEASSRSGRPLASPTDEAVAREAAGWIRQQRSPWLAWVSPGNKPHAIYCLKRVPPRPGVSPPFSDLRDLAGKPSEQQEYVDRDQGRSTRSYGPEDWIVYRSYYLQLVEEVDANLGTVLAAVSDMDSTIVVSTSDHGDALGEHGLPFKGPFMYEEEIRIPLVIRAPGAFSGPRQRNDLVTQADLAPTLASLAGIKWPRPVAGEDLSQGPLPRDAVFLEYHSKQKWVNPIRTIRAHRWKLNLYDRGHKELYDLQADPRETRNLAGTLDVRAIQPELEARLNAWRGPVL